MTGQVRVRFAGSKDLTWCSSQDESVDQEVLEGKIPWKEILIAEMAGKRVGYLRMEYLWSKIPYIGLVKVNQDQRARNRPSNAEVSRGVFFAKTNSAF